MYLTQAYALQSVAFECDFNSLFSFVPLSSMLRTLLFRSPARLGSHATWQFSARNFTATGRRKAEVQLTIDGKQVSIEGNE